MSIIEAPATYTNPLPHNVSFNIVPNSSNFFMNSLPIGNYKFHFLDACGNEFDVLISLQGFQVTSNGITVSENCSSFNLTLTHSNNSPFSNTFWLQKYNPVTSQWTNPLTGIVYVEGTELNAVNSLILNNNSTNSNLAYSGIFRVIMSFKVFGNGTFIDQNCFKVVDNFEFNSGPKILDIYSFSCATTTSDVVVLATGLGPLLYRITTKNGTPFVIQNATSNVFVGLQTAVYNFQVEDVCGNILNRVLDIATPYVFSISATNLCQGQVGSLSVPNFPFLTYQWWQGNNTATILSTTSNLSFPNFNSTTDNGIYHVSVSNPGNANSCVNFTLDYEISATANTPNAGTGTTISYCGNQGIIDLFTLLTGTFDIGGTWEEITNSGGLLGNLWNSTTVASGNYQFKYRVNGFCTAYDESSIDITIKSVPETPIAFLEQVICDTQSLNLLATTIPNAIYQWTGPNGFTSAEQNPIITSISPLNNGTYTVKVIENGCESGVATIEVVVSSLPQFTIEGACIQNVFTVIANPTNNSYNPNTVNYSWTGPNDFVSSESAINITGLTPGNYSLTITNPEGCFASNSIEISNTLCSIPQGVSANNDGDNDTFNLTGFEVKNLKIFNRYGMTVFEQENYTNQWHGQDYNNNELPSATYYYLLKLATGEIKSGWVYLIR
jgi:gliding motility-associated-like protein